MIRGLVLVSVGAIVSKCILVGSCYNYRVGEKKKAYRKTKEPAMPPSPPKPTKVAEQKARFHWPRILVAW